MDIPAAWILSQLSWELLRGGAGITLTTLKKHAQKWLLSDSEFQELANEIDVKIDGTESGPAEIYEKISNSETIKNLETKICNSYDTNISQTHYGTGDNIAGDKYSN